MNSYLLRRDDQGCNTSESLVKDEDHRIALDPICVIELSTTGIEVEKAEACTDIKFRVFKRGMMEEGG